MFDPTEQLESSDFSTQHPKALTPTFTCISVEAEQKLANAQARHLKGHRGGAGSAVTARGPSRTEQNR